MPRDWDYSFAIWIIMAVILVVAMWKIAPGFFDKAFPNLMPNIGSLKMP